MCTAVKVSEFSVSHLSKVTYSCSAGLHTYFNNYYFFLARNFVSYDVLVIIATINLQVKVSCLQYRVIYCNT